MEYERARELRTRGSSIREIAEELGVAKSSVSEWVRDIELAPEQAADLLARDPVASGRTLGHEAWSRLCRERREAAQEDGRSRARAADPLHRAGCMLYWAEGSKTSSQMVFTNSDVEMMRFFLSFLRGCYGIGDDDVRLSVNCFLGNGLSLDQIESWWLAALGLPRTCLRAAAVNRGSKASKGIRRPLVYGTAQLKVHSTALKQSILGAIQEYAGFEREEWLAPAPRRRVV